MSSLREQMIAAGLATAEDAERLEGDDENGSGSDDSLSGIAKRYHSRLNETHEYAELLAVAREWVEATRESWDEELRLEIEEWGLFEEGTPCAPSALDAAERDLECDLPASYRALMTEVGGIEFPLTYGWSEMIPVGDLAKRSVFLRERIEERYSPSYRGYYESLAVGQQSFLLHPDIVDDPRVVPIARTGADLWTLVYNRVDADGECPLILWYHDDEEVGGGLLVRDAVREFLSVGIDETTHRLLSKGGTGAPT